MERPCKGMAENDNMLRIITYNIHCWHSAFWESNCRQVQAYLGRLKPHVVGFQEHTSDERVAFVSNPPNTSYTMLIGPALDREFGNAILCQTTNDMSFSDFENFQADRNIDDNDPIGQNEMRAICKVNVDFASKPDKRVHFTVYCTHLDHRDESVRMEQLKWMRLRFIESETPHIIMGDFNSLRADDFSREYLAKIGHERAQSNWESPQFDVTAQMIEWGYTDVFKRLNPRAKDLEVETNHYHTRIDFIWVSEQMAALLDWTSSRCWIDKEMAASDHYPVVADLQFL